MAKEQRFQVGGAEVIAPICAHLAGETASTHPGPIADITAWVMELQTENARLTDLFTDIRQWIKDHDHEQGGVSANATLRAIRSTIERWEHGE